MKFLCCDCGHKFKGAIKDEARECPICSSKKEEHLPEIATPLTEDSE